MEFDKKAYWDNRKAGRRGQGPYPNPVVKLAEGSLPATSARGLGLRHKRHATKVATSQMDFYTKQRDEIADRVGRQQGRAMNRAAERRAERQAQRRKAG